MKLLIVTQVVDLNYVSLCFFVRWLEEFGKRCERVTVISQRVGEYALPANVRVLSLGKERGASKVSHVFRSWWFMWRERRNYDAVLVHMTPIWVVLGAPIWMLLRKQVYLWYEARGTRWNLRLALMLVKKAFSASPGGMPIKTKKSVITGHGIDTEFFHPMEEQRDPHLLVTVGRLTKAKRLHLIIDAFAKLSSQYRLRIIGVPITEEDSRTLQELKEKIRMLGVHPAPGSLRCEAEEEWCAKEETTASSGAGFRKDRRRPSARCRQRELEGLQDRVTFGTIPDAELAILLRHAVLFLHASNATSLDKAPLQAMASGCLVVTASSVVKPHVPEVCRSEPETMADVIQNLLSMPQEDQENLRRQLRAIVDREHALPKLIERLVREMS